MKKNFRLHRLEHYYRDVVDFDTAHDARHALSLLTSIFPDIRVSFPDFDTVRLENIKNHLFSTIVFRWRNKV